MDPQHNMGTDGFVWFFGLVEDRDDPKQVGRVRVRCFGFHDQDDGQLPTTALPWARWCGDSSSMVTTANSHSLLER
jgi:hypothetical protein